MRIKSNRYLVWRMSQFHTASFSLSLFRSTNTQQINDSIRFIFSLMQTIIYPRIQSQYLKHFHIRSKCKVFGSAKTFGMLQTKKSATISFNSICSLYYFYNLFIHLSFFHLNAFIKFSSLRWHFPFFSLFPIFCLFCFVLF